MTSHPSDAAAIQAMWDVLRGAAIPARLPAEISGLATRHGCAAALYSILERGGARDAVDYTDWCLLRGFAFFHRARARRFRELLATFAADAPPAPWYVWKGAALLLLLDGYDERFEAADVDIAVQPGALDAWAGFLKRNGAAIGKRGTHGFQARFDADATRPAIIVDLKEEERIPPLQLAAGVPVPVEQQHLALMHEHARKHADLPAPKLRMVYDAWLAGAEWHDEMYRLLFPAAAATAHTAAPSRVPPAEASAQTHEIAGDACVVLVDADRSFAFDRDAVQRSLPRLLAHPDRPSATARLELRLDAEADPYGIEERSDRTVLWVQQYPSARENKRLIAALVQRAYQSIGLLTLHCTVVARGAKAVALLGSFGSGKTLTSLNMVNAGAGVTLLAGDAALVAADGRVAGGTREAWLDRALRDRTFPHLTGRDDDGTSGRAPRVDVAESIHWTPLDSAPPTLVALVFVSVSPSPAADSFVTPLTPDTAAQNLFRASSYRFDTILPSCSLSLTDLEPRPQRHWRVAQCHTLAHSIPTLRLTGPLAQATTTALTLLD
jgi:hypothetical protein